jgi:hypothetical protein
MVYDTLLQERMVFRHQGSACKCLAHEVHIRLRTRKYTEFNQLRYNVHPSTRHNHLEEIDPVTQYN